MSIDSLKKELDDLKEKRKKTEEITKIRAEIEKEKKAIKGLKPKSWIEKLFERDEY